MNTITTINADSKERVRDSIEVMERYSLDLNFKSVF